MTAARWTREFWRDLGERVATTAVYGLIVMLTADASGAISGDPQQWWLIVGLPTVLALLKGVLAGIKDPETGASLLSDPPPRVERGASALEVALVVLIAVVVLLLLVPGLR